MSNNGDQGTRDPVRTTIVGGQPGENTGAAHGVPKGIEGIIALAATDDKFRKQLIADRDEAIASAGLALTDTERAVLRSIPDEHLLRTTGGASGATEPRRGFLRLALAALVGGAAAMVDGCDQRSPVTGSRPALPVDGSPVQDPDAPPSDEDASETEDADGPVTQDEVGQPDADAGDPSQAVTRGIRPDVPPPHPSPTAEDND